MINLPKKPPPSLMVFAGIPTAVLFSYYCFFKVGFNLTDFKENLEKDGRFKKKENCPTTEACYVPHTALCQIQLAGDDQHTFLASSPPLYPNRPGMSLQ